ncbi:hypothetical protein HNV11_15395 [Spirosoma taeanense]|uniref:Uncharacterized protein n=1 Tax=Spirosoma taeanense TaxID=2735870 RepID=A0A6M5Y2C9_9BACT|nr:hypothetical protein [Spirosoma taeanense]QJW87865.1 hypothetical protein HNV11_15395 [Spirosoma taeanense]
MSASDVLYILSGTPGTWSYAPINSLSHRTSPVITLILFNNLLGLYRNECHYVIPYWLISIEDQALKDGEVSLTGTYHEKGRLVHARFAGSPIRLQAEKNQYLNRAG